MSKIKSSSPQHLEAIKKWETRNADVLNKFNTGKITEDDLRWKQCQKERYYIDTYWAASETR